jgi:hypothetical protein
MTRKRICGATPRNQTSTHIQLSSWGIKASLARILASPQFRASPRLASFLRYVVEKALAGEGKHLKGYTIGVEALGRPENFDPQIDPIVRVEAGRLRRALARYYARDGATEPIWIELPRGCYVPRFRAGTHCESASSEAKSNGQAKPPPLPPSASPFRSLVETAEMMEAVVRTQLDELTAEIAVTTRTLARSRGLLATLALTESRRPASARLAAMRFPFSDVASIADGQQYRQAVDVVTTLDELIAHVTGVRDLKTAVEVVLDAAIRLHAADFGNVQLLDERSRELTIFAQRGFKTPFVEFFARVTVEDTSACGLAMQQGHAVIIEDVELEPSFARYRAVAAEAGFRAVQSTPLIASTGKLVGVLSTHFVRPHRPSKLDMQTTRLYARVAADILERLVRSEALRSADPGQASLPPNGHAATNRTISIRASGAGGREERQVEPPESAAAARAGRSRAG